MATVIRQGEDLRFKGISEGFKEGFDKGFATQQDAIINKEKSERLNIMLEQLNSKEGSTGRDALQLASQNPDIFETPEKAVEFAKFYESTIKEEGVPEAVEITVDGIPRTTFMNEEQKRAAALNPDSINEILGLGGNVQLGSHVEETVKIVNKKTGAIVKEVPKAEFDPATLAENEGTIGDFDRADTLAAKQAKQDEIKIKQDAEIRAGEELKIKQDTEKRGGEELKIKQDAEKRAQDSEKRAQAKEVRVEAKERREELKQESNIVDPSTDEEKRAAGRIANKTGKEEFTGIELAQEMSMMDSEKTGVKIIADTFGVQLSDAGAIEKISRTGNDFRYNMATRVYPELLESLTPGRAQKAAIAIGNDLTPPGGDDGTPIKAIKAIRSFVSTDDMKAKLASSKASAGSVFKIPTKDPDTPFSYFIVVGTDSNSGELLFNIFTP